MDTGFLVSFLLWCAIANYGVLLLSFVAFVRTRGWIHKLHSRWFGLSTAQLDVSCTRGSVPTSWRSGSS